MAFLESFLLVVHVLVAIAICGLVLLQHGKGADMGAAFGSGIRSLTVSPTVTGSTAPKPGAATSPKSTASTNPSVASIA